MHVNVSHMIHDLSFGPKYPGLHNPLDGTVRILHETSGIFKYYIKVSISIFLFIDQRFVANATQLSNEPTLMIHVFCIKLIV